MFSNRAAAYIKRKWHGDYYAALKDCVTALKLEPNHMKAHFRLAVCLYELEKLNDSKMYLDQFTKKHPSYKTSAAFKVLYGDILLAQRKNEDKIDGNSNSSIIYIYIIYIISSKINFPSITMYRKKVLGFIT